MSGNPQLGTVDIVGCDAWKVSRKSHDPRSSRLPKSAACRGRGRDRTGRDGDGQVTVTACIGTGASARMTAASHPINVFTARNNLLMFFKSNTDRDTGQ